MNHENNAITKACHDFFTMVTEMREAQRHYFKTRSLTDLAKSKELERKVDDFIYGVKNPKLL